MVPDYTFEYADVEHIAYQCPPFPFSRAEWHEQSTPEQGNSGLHVLLLATDNNPENDRKRGACADLHVAMADRGP